MSEREILIKMRANYIAKAEMISQILADLPAPGKDTLPIPPVPICPMPIPHVEKPKRYVSTLAERNECARLIATFMPANGKEIAFADLLQKLLPHFPNLTDGALYERLRNLGYAQKRRGYYHGPPIIEKE